MRATRKCLVAMLLLACLSTFGVGMIFASADTVTPKTVDEVAITMEEGAAVRMAETYTDLGIRYSFTMSETDYNALMANTGEDGAYSSLSYGVFVAPKMYYDIHKIDNEAELLQYYCWNGEEKGKEEILNMTSKEMLVHEEKSDVRVFYGAVVNMLPENLLTEYIGIGYVKYTTNATETKASETHYRFITQNDNVRSMVYVAQKAIDDNKDENGILASSYLTETVKNQNSSYNVEYWLQQTDGSYALDTSNSKTITENVKVAQNVDMDVIDIVGYEYDAGNENEVLSGTVYANGKLTLKAYYNQCKVSLSTAAYYQYDESGNVTLPTATCAIEGATIVYTVTNPAGKTVELDADMVYATNGVAGTYVYTAKATVDGETVASETKDILIHSENVLLGSGLSADNVNNSALSFGNPVFSFTTEEAAPGELGSMKVDNSANANEPGNFNIRLESTPIVGKTMITFYVKNTSKTALGLQMYSASTWLYGNYWYNGQKYEQNATGVMDYVIQPSSEWQKIEAFTFRPDGASISGSDIRLQFASTDYAWDSESAPIIYVSNIYYDLPTFAAEPEDSTIPANVLVANGCGESNFQGNKMDMGTGTTYTYCAEESAPGENGSLKLDNTNHLYGEKGNFNLQLGAAAVGKSMITFYIKHTGSQPLGINVYGIFNGYPQSSTNFWFNGVRYESGDQFPIQGSDEWQKVEVLLTDVSGFPVSGEDIRLNIVSQNYAWGEGEAPVIYLSNIYYS